uniref:Secreted protein n=1 Tax=Globodera rostochiensis TaxID=31243 RepID=A0A914GPG0_GLORO
MCNSLLLLFLLFFTVATISARLTHQSFGYILNKTNSQHRHFHHSQAVQQTSKNIYNKNRCYRQPPASERVQKRWASKNGLT